MDQPTAEDILKGKFIRQVLGNTAKDIDNAQIKLMTSRGFERQEWYSGRSFNITDASLTETLLTKHRFIDMKTRDSKKGKHPKKNYPVYNKIIWGHYNNLVRELSFGFTEAVTDDLRKIQNP